MQLDRRSFLKRTGAGAALATMGSGLFTSSAFATNPPKFQGKSDVSFVGSSSSGTRRKMISDVLAPWKSVVENGIEGKTILIKVNMVYWNPGMPDPTLSLTHVDAVRGLLDFLRSINSTIPVIIGDCTANASDLGNITTMFDNTHAKYEALTTEYQNVTLVDLNTFAAEDRHFWSPNFDASTPASIPVIKAFYDPKYYVISICRPKTHSSMIITGVNKNILMGAPLHSLPNGDLSTNTKQFMHGQNGWYDGKNPDENKCLAFNIFQMANILYTTGTPALSVLDAWEGMEGDGPVSGTSIMQYCAVAGVDPLAVDRLAAKLMGFSDTPTDPINITTPSYTDMRALVWMSNAGLGNYDLSKINFILGSLSDLDKYITKYTMSPLYSGDPSYETNWTGSPSTVFDQAAAIKDSRFLDPKPFMVPQMQKTIAGDELTINFILPVSFHIKLGIYNMKGVEICRLGDEFLPGGRYSKQWNRRDNTGSRVPAGRYIIKLSFDSRALCDAISLVR